MAHRKHISHGAGEVFQNLESILSHLRMSTSQNDPNAGGSGKFDNFLDNDLSALEDLELLVEDI